MTTQLLELPPAWLARLFQHVAKGPGGLAHAAALSQTCGIMRSICEGPVVTYRNLSLGATITTPDHPFWQWLAKRSGRVAGLRLELRLGMLNNVIANDEDDDVEEASEDADKLHDWMQPLQTLSGIPDVQLTVAWVGEVDHVDHPCVSLWLKQHGQLISRLIVEVHASDHRLKLREFSEAAAPCKSIDLKIRHHPNQVLDLVDLSPVAGSLHCLSCQCSVSGMPLALLSEHGILRSPSAFNSMSQLTALQLAGEEFHQEDSWILLAKLTSLQQLCLTVTASGDPSPLSALKGLSCLYLHSLGHDPDGPTPFSFSSLQPLSTLQQLEVLHLGSNACTATSLQGLAGLSNLKQFVLGSPAHGGLVSLEGISPRVVEFTIAKAAALVSLAGLEVCTSMEKLTLRDCAVSSLQALRGLSSVKELQLSMCSVTSLEGLNCASLHSLSLILCNSLTQLFGVEHLSALRTLEVLYCRNVSSLQPLSQIGEVMQRLVVSGCHKVQEEVLELPHVPPTAEVEVEYSNVKEVVLAGGVRRAALY
jgi:hypothetical protein